MGYTHFQQPTGTTGVYTGAKGAEVPIHNKNAVITWVAGSTSAATAYIVSPYSASVSGYHVQGGAAPAVPGAVTATVGSAGAILLTGTPASAGAAGNVLALSNTSGTTTIDAGGSIKLDLAASGTAFSQTVTIVLTRAGA